MMPTRIEQPTDNELIRRARDGDQSAVDALLDRHQGVIWMYARRFGKSWPAVDVDDLFQTGALAFIRSIAKFDPARGFKLSTYAGTAARRAMYDLVQLNLRSEQRLRIVDPADLDIGAEDDRDQAEELEHIRALLADHLAALPPDRLSAIRSYFGLECERETMGTIAQRAGVSRQRIHQRVKDGLKRLRAAMG
jgi:RNA polymerase sigma factor (sigma-70 family)